MKSLSTSWPTDRLKDIAAINGQSLSANTDLDYEFDYLEISNVNYFGVIDSNAIERLRYEDAPSRARRKIPKNSTVISSVRPNLQAVAFFPEAGDDYICSTGFNVVLPHAQKLDPHFAYFVLISENTRQYFEATAKGVGYPAVDDKDFNSLLIPLPPLPEQKRIAAYLDASCRAIDAAVAAKRRQIEVLDELRKTTIQQAVSEGFSESRLLAQSRTKLVPPLPHGWIVKRLKDIAIIRYGLGQPPAEKDGGIPMLRATNVDAGKISEKGLLFIDPDELPLDRNPYLKEDEIIVVRSGAYTGDSAIVPRQYAGSVAGYDMVVTVTHAEPKFIAYGLLSNYVLDGQMLLLTLRAAQPHLNADELGNIFFALPPAKKEQQAIVAELEPKLARIASIESLINSQISTLTAYRKSLIHECVTSQRRITEQDLHNLQERMTLDDK